MPSHDPHPCSKPRRPASSGKFPRIQDAPRIARRAAPGWMECHDCVVRERTPIAGIQVALRRRAFGKPHRMLWQFDVGPGRSADQMLRRDQHVFHEHGVIRRKIQRPGRTIPPDGMRRDPHRPYPPRLQMLRASHLPLSDPLHRPRRAIDRQDLMERGFIYDSSMLNAINPYFHAVGGKPDALVELPWSWSLNDAVYALSSVKAPRSIMINDHISTVWRDEFDAIRAAGRRFNLVMYPQVAGQPSRLRLPARMIEYIRQFDDVWFAGCRSAAEAFAGQSGRGE